MVKIYSQHENTVIWWTAFFIKILQHVSFVKAGAYLAFSGCCKAKKKKKKSKYLNSKKKKDQNH